MRQPYRKNLGDKAEYLGSNLTFVVLIVGERSEPGKPSFQKFSYSRATSARQLMYNLSKREFSFLKEVIRVPRIGRGLYHTLNVLCQLESSMLMGGYHYYYNKE